MTTWTIINGDTLCLNGRPVAHITSMISERDRHDMPLEESHEHLTRDERRELLEALNGEER